ncbi:MAG: HEPN domain-containing protein [Methanobrevibacter sp.]|nr:HEPN domain-containing protein [Candidatus Methanovirga meridionalis]
MDKTPEFFFELSLESLKDSKIAIENGRYRMAENRSYYAVFYAAEALLLKKGISNKTHAGTISKFGLEYVVKENFNSEIAKFISNLEEARSKVDYGYVPEVSEDKAIKDYRKAEKFIEECKKFL